MLTFKSKQLKMIELIRLLKHLDQQVSQCSRCGICQSVCPLYKVTQDESDVARGKLMLLDGLMRSFFEDPNGVSQRLNRCLLCGSCETNCPRGVNIVEIFLHARTIISGYSGLPVIKKLIFRKLLSNPAFFDRLMFWGTKWQYLFYKKAEFQLDASCAKMVSPLLSVRHLVPLAPVPFHKQHAEFEIAESNTGPKVAFFVGCLLDKVFPKVASDIVRVLNFHNMRPVIPDFQGCCGIPALSSGDYESFNHLVVHNAGRFDPSGFDYLVTGCATCTATIKKIWPSMVSLDNDHLQKAVHGIADKTMDINQFLVEVVGIHLPERPAEESGKPIVTYHDPCHLRKTLQVVSAPRQLLKTNDCFAFSEMVNADECCGMGGSFNLTNYNLSTDIGKKKISSVLNSGAAVVATGCPACMMQLSDMLVKENRGIRVAHTIELYCEQLFGP